MRFVVVHSLCALSDYVYIHVGAYDITDIDDAEKKSLRLPEHQVLIVTDTIQIPHSLPHVFIC